MTASMHLVGVGGDRHRNAERAADRLVLADQDVEHESVDLVVDAVIGDHPDDLRGLAVAVDPPLALLVAGGVPRQVVMDDGVEVLLQVDPFAQAVGADQHALRAPRASWSTRSSRSAGGRVPVTASTSTPLGRRAPQLAGEVLGRRDEPAEDDRVIAVARAAP